MTIHLLGMYLLYTLRRKTSQHIYLLNLAIIEIVKNCLNFIKTMPYFFQVPNNVNSVIQTVDIYNAMCYDYVVMMAYYSTMFFITFDRYKRIAKNRVHTRKRSRASIACVWIFGFFLFTIVLILYQLKSLPDVLLYRCTGEPIFISFIHPIIDISFIGFAIIAYGIIFFKYSESHRRMSVSTPDNERESICHTFCQSRLFLAILLVISFFVFTATPDLIFLHYKLNNKTLNRRLHLVCCILFATSDVADAVIYIFVERRVRQSLSRMIKRRKRLRKSSVIAVVRSSSTVVTAGL